MTNLRRKRDVVLAEPPRLHVATPSCDTTKSTCLPTDGTHIHPHEAIMHGHCARTSSSSPGCLSLSAVAVEAALPRPCPSGRCARHTAAALSTAWTGSPLAPAGRAAAVPVVQAACVRACLCVCACECARAYARYESFERGLGCCDRSMPRIPAGALR